MKSFGGLSVFVCISGIVLVFGDENTNCKTPKNSPGLCKEIASCKSLLSIVQNRPINSTNADFLMKSRCGNSDDSRKVCCPISETTTVSRNGPSKSYETPVPTSSPLLPDHQTCGIDSPNKIYGGEQTDIREFPWMVLIENRGPNCSTICGGVLINNRYVLTAAHCFKGKGLPRSCNLTTVRLGEYNLDTDPDCVEEIKGCAPPVRIIPAEEKIVHEDYDPYNFNRYNDVALLRLAEEIEYTAYIKPICLPITAHDHSQNFTGRKLTVAGYGQTEDSTAPYSKEKLKVKLLVRNNEYCNNLYRDSSISLNGGQMCVGGEKGKDSCKGDSGGPLMDMYADGEKGKVNWYSIGIVSFGPTPCGSENWPGVYVKVANYVSWIVSKLRS